MSTTTQHQDYLAYPTGKSAKSSFCDCCKTYNARHVTCVAVIVNSKQKILLIKRAINPCKGYWALPGGYLDWDETAAQAASREVMEETGLAVPSNDLHFLHIMSDPTRDPDGRQNVELAFWARVEGVAADQLSGEEVFDIQWWSLDQLPELAFDHSETIRHYRQQQS